MKEDFETVYDMIEHAIELAFDGKMQLKFYDYLKYRKTTKVEVDSFIESSTAAEISDQVLELEQYIEGGADNNHKQLREAYGHIPKPQARKIKNYLYSIINDAWRYSRDRKKGRRKKQSK